MKPELSPESKAKVAQALAMVEESCARMDKYTEAERAELERQGRELMAESLAEAPIWPQWWPTSPDA